MTIDTDTLAEVLADIKRGETKKARTPEPEVNWFEKPADQPEGTPFKEVFGWEPRAPLNVTVLKGQPDVPVADDCYIFPKEATEDLVRVMEWNGKTRLVGPPGAGKTELVKQVCAKLGRSFARLNFNIAMEPDDIFGYVRIVDGDTKFVEGDFPKWMREGYTVLLDEINRAPASFHMAMQRLLEEGGELHLPQKEEDNLITPHTNFRLVSADNTKGLGDDMDRFGSAHIQDVSSLNRWDICVELDYLDQDQEMSMLTTWYPEMTTHLARKLASVSMVLHGAYRERELDLPFSPRTLKRVGRLALAYENPVYAIKKAYADFLDSEQKAMVDKLVCDTVKFKDSFGRIV